MTLSAQQQNWSVVSHSGFFATPETPALSDPTPYIDRLKDTMSNIQYRPTRQLSQPSTCVHKDLNQCTHVFVRHDAIKPPLQPTYDGPFKVIDCNERHFVTELNPNDRTLFQLIVSNLLTLYTHLNTFTIHHTPPIPPSTPPAQTRQTRSGHVQLPDVSSKLLIFN